jgi:RND family efflux transporter MFP subunit
MRRVLRALHTHWKWSLVGMCVLGLSGLFLRDIHHVPAWTTGTAERGTVSRTTSVSGTLRATQTAHLGFPVGGLVESIHTHEGATVTAGQELMALAHANVTAEYEEARAAFAVAQADYDELLAGMRPEERVVATTKVAIAEEDLLRITREQNEQVASAYRTLLSSDVAALPQNLENNDTAPTVSGTYTCDEGSYTLSLFRSGTRSGYSYRMRGIEEGTYTVYTEAPGPLGACGLSIQFADEPYETSDWLISIPNKKSASYVTNMNAYNLARTARDNAIREAEQALALAQQTDTVANAAPRNEALARAAAYVRQSAARIASVEADLSDHVLIAPFDGVITKIEPVVGERVGTDTSVTMISYAAFELTALIPEIDVTRVAPGQKASVVFDARQEETLSATVARISPLAREINGVSYFEAALTLDTPVDWFRGGLNADIDIVLDARTDVVRIPKRFLIEDGGASFVLVPDGHTTRRIAVSPSFFGNDGFVAVEGLHAGDSIIAP